MVFGDIDGDGALNAVWAFRTRIHSNSALAGDLDLYVTNINTSNKLYRNDGNGSFADITTDAHVGDTGNARGVSMGDLNSDGHLDIYVRFSARLRRCISHRNAEPNPKRLSHRL